MSRFDWIVATVKTNWGNLTTHRGAFWSMAALMALQNLIYFALWAVLFSRISSLRGWGMREVAFLYGSGALGYGVLFTIFGGLNQLGSTVHSGMLDVFLARPRPVLLSVLLQRMRADSIGDIVASIVMLSVFVQPSLSELPLLLVVSLSSGFVYASFRLIMHTLSFWGLGIEASENGFIAFLIASTNPQKGFSNWGKFVLLTVFPAGYVGFLPVEILRSFSWPVLGLQLLGSLLIVLFSLALFNTGLKRYASGNQFLSLR
jgi:ABC-2 type transport system permease protein